HDVYVPVTPLAYLIEGLIFKVFGPGMLTSRLLMAATYAATVAVTFRIAAACTTPIFACIAALCAMLLQLWMWPHPLSFTSTPLAALFSIVALDLARCLENAARRARYAVALGVALALATWAKPNLGAMVVAGIGAYWLTTLVRGVAGLPVSHPRTLA